MDICSRKNQIGTLLNEIFTEYNRINESKIQSSLEKELEMRVMSETIRSLEKSELENSDKIKNLEKTVNDYEKIINDLQSKFELVKEEESENNKFDMLRVQSKEISEKSREIDRLNGLLSHYQKQKKDNKSKKIDDVLSSIKKENISEIKLQEVTDPVSSDKVVSDEVKSSSKDTSTLVIEPVDPETGEVNPNFIYPSPEPEPSPGGSIHSNDGENDTGNDAGNDGNLRVLASIISVIYNTLLDTRQRREAVFGTCHVA